jgi:hypothetical protein
MGLISKSGSFTRYRVDEKLPEGFFEDLPARIARHAFRVLDETSVQERSAGWVSIMDMFDSTFKAMEYIMEPWLALSWRVDVRKVPKNALIQYSREAEERAKASEAVEFLPKWRKKEIREATKIKLMQRAIPQSNTYDMIWNLQTGVVIFAATRPKLCDEFAEFFLTCFGLHLKPVHPMALAAELIERLGISPAVLDGLSYSIPGGGR